MATETAKAIEAPTDGRRLFDLQAAAAYLRELGAEGVTLNFVRVLVNSGQVPHLRMGRRFYLTRESLDRWITNHERKR